MIERDDASEASPIYLDNSPLALAIVALADEMLQEIAAEEAA